MRHYAARGATVGHVRAPRRRARAHRRRRARRRARRPRRRRPRRRRAAVAPPPRTCARRRARPRHRERRRLARHADRARGGPAGVSRGHRDERPRDGEHVPAVREPRCAQRGRGTLVGIASVAGFRGIPGSGAYSASKAAAITYLESLRVEMARQRRARRDGVPGLRRDAADRAQPVPRCRSSWRPTSPRARIARVLAAQSPLRRRAVADGRSSGALMRLMPRRALRPRVPARAAQAARRVVTARRRTTRAVDWAGVVHPPAGAAPRIACLVPSLTELLFALDLGDARRRAHRLLRASARRRARGAEDRRHEGPGRRAARDARADARRS